MAAVLGKFVKQPAEILDYDVDFTDWFSNREDAPSGHLVVAEPGITVASTSLAGNVVKIVLSGGTNGSKYKITVRLNTTNSMVKEADFVVAIKEV